MPRLWASTSAMASGFFSMGGTISTAVAVPPLTAMRTVRASLPFEPEAEYPADSGLPWLRPPVAAPAPRPPVTMPARPVSLAWMSILYFAGSSAAVTLAVPIGRPSSETP